MKMRSALYLVGLGIVLNFGVQPASAELEVSASVQIHAKAEFEAPLAAHGTWVEVGSYGRCWRPAGLTLEWRPYCSGEWVWTDCGWYWASDEPWAWACYHYGNWIYDAHVGWVWLPGVEWAPAWVSWRVGGGFIGWAPLPPPGLFFAHRPTADRFVFVNEAHFVGPVRPATVLLKNSAFISHTTEVGGVKRQTLNLPGTGSQKVMVNQGPDTERLQQTTGKAVRVVSIGEALRRTRVPTEVKRPASNSKGERYDSEGRPGPEHDRGGRDDAPARDHSGPSSDGFGPSFGPGSGHGHGGGGHGRGRG